MASTLFELLDAEASLGRRAAKGDRAAADRLRAVRAEIARRHDERFDVDTSMDATTERLGLCRMIGRL